MVSSVRVFRNEAWVFRRLPWRVDNLKIETSATLKEERWGTRNSQRTRSWRSLAKVKMVCRWQSFYGAPSVSCAVTTLKRPSVRRCCTGLQIRVLKLLRKADSRLCNNGANQSFNDSVCPLSRSANDWKSRYLLRTEGVTKKLYKAASQPKLAHYDWVRGRRAERFINRYHRIKLTLVRKIRQVLT